MAKKHVNAEKMANSQKAAQSKARKEKQALRGSPKFGKGSNDHNGGSLGQSGHPRKGR